MKALVTGQFIAIILSLLAFPAKAQTDKILSGIEKANSSVSTVEAHFSQTRTILASGKKTEMEGILYFSAPDKMSMHYSTPAFDLLTINGNQFHLKRSGKASTYNTDKNALMGSLSKTLLRCIKGQVSATAEDNDADVEAKSNGNNWEVTLLARKKAARGYSKIILEYRKSDGMLVSMEMVEFSGISNLYRMSDILTGMEIDKSVYIIP